jgi:hypothetical protein
LTSRSVFFNVFQSLVVLLYVLDNETNTIIRCVHRGGEVAREQLLKGG